MQMIDIIIPTYNNLEELKLCLKGLEQQTFKQFRVFICIDGSTDGTEQFLEKATYSFTFEMLFHKNKSNRGRSATRNLALPHLHPDHFLLLIDSDIIPDRNLLEAHFSLLQEKDCISVGDILYTNKKENIWAAYTATRGRHKSPHLEELPAKYFTSGNVAMKSAHFIDVQGFDEDFSKTYGGEDTEIGIRLHAQRSLPLINNKKAFGLCVMQKSLENALSQIRLFGRTNFILLLRKHPLATDVFKTRKSYTGFIKSGIITIIYWLRFDAFLRSVCKVMPETIRNKMITILVYLEIQKGVSESEK